MCWLDIAGKPMNSVEMRGNWSQMPVMFQVYICLLELLHQTSKCTSSLTVNCLGIIFKTLTWDGDIDDQMHYEIVSISQIHTQTNRAIRFILISPPVQIPMIFKRLLS